LAPANGIDYSIVITEITAKMMVRFREAFGSGAEGEVANDHLVLGPRQHSKGLPKYTLIASFLDPRTKAGIGIPAQDQQSVWQWIK
jgi:hypothetical protein